MCIYVYIFTYIYVHTCRTGEAHSITQQFSVLFVIARTRPTAASRPAALCQKRIHYVWQVSGTHNTACTAMSMQKCKNDTDAEGSMRMSFFGRQRI